MSRRRSNGVPDASFADRLRGKGKPANPLNLIRFVPAEGLDASDTAPQFPFNSNEGGADAHDFSPDPAALAALPLRRPRAQEKLTVYTYESFTAEWGPGPQVEKAFEAECGCDLEFVAVADGVALLNRVKLEGASTKADIVLGLDTNLTAEAKATGLFAPAGIDLAGVDGSRRLDRRHFRALRLRLFRRRLRHARS